MTESLVEKIAQAVLYEGFILYPYRTSLKNQQRWTFGGLYPQAYSEAQSGTDAWTMQVQCLVQGTESATIQPTVRFLHPLDRQVGKLAAPLLEWPREYAPPFEFVDQLQFGTRRISHWQEAVERTVNLPVKRVRDLLNQPLTVAFNFPASQEIEPVLDLEGQIAGVIVRVQDAISGTVELTMEPLARDLFQVTLQIKNGSPLEVAYAKVRDRALMRSMMSTHSILRVEGAEFLSMIDPPPECAAAAALCQNLGTWPVLVGEPGEKQTLLAAPIILYDYPQLSPESPGDLFDGTEIDEILTLRILTLTANEKDAMCGLDERAREILERTETLASDQLLDLHGGMRTLPSRERVEVAIPDWTPWDDAPGLQSVVVAGTTLKPGDRIRLRPRRGGDIFDTALDGKAARIESIEQDFENRVHLAVSVDDDPGRDFGRQKLPAHRFFFRLDEVEPLPDSRSE